MITKNKSRGFARTEGSLTPRTGDAFVWSLRCIRGAGAEARFICV